MSHEYVGIATIDSQTTSIRKYSNGMYVVEVNGDVKYSGENLDELKEKLESDKIKYSITKRSD